MIHRPQKTEITTASKQLSTGHAYDAQFRDLALHTKGTLSDET